MDIPTSFICIIIFINEDFKYGNVSKFLDYIGANADLLCAQFCNFVQSHILLA
jgi:hypothetical protein